MTSEENKIAFIGPKEYSKAFSFLGFYCFCAKDEKEANESIEKAKKEGFVLIFVSQDVLKKETPDIILLPGIVSKKDENYLKEEIKRAVGAKIPILGD